MFIILGPSTYLSPEQETKLAFWIKSMCKIGYGKTKREIPLVVKDVLDSANVSNSKFENNLPSDSWVYSFLKRHPSISARIPEQLGTARAQVTREKIDEWFQTLQTFMKEEMNIDAESFFSNPDNASRVYNLDESGFPLAGTGAGARLKVLSEVGVKSVIKITPETKDQITVLATICADGSFMKPLILFPGLTYRNVNLRSVDPEKFHVGLSESGWMTSESFFSYIVNCLFKELTDRQIQFPVIIFLDGHSSHINLALAQFCKEKKIYLYCFPPHASHILQPLDTCVFGPLKGNWNKSLRDYAANNVNEPMKKSLFLQVFLPCWEKSSKSTYAKEGFKKAGLVPFNPENVDYTKLVQERRVQAEKGPPNAKSCEKSLTELVAYQQCINIVEKHIAKHDKELFQKRVKEGYDVPDDHTTPSIWKIYRDIVSLKSSSSGTTTSNDQGTNAIQMNVEENNTTEMITVAEDITVSSANVLNDAVLEVEGSFVAETLSDISMPQSPIASCSAGPATVSTPVESTAPSLTAVATLPSADPVPSTSVVSLENTFEFEKYDSSPFKSFLRLPDSIVKSSRPRKPTDVPPAVGGTQLYQALQDKYNKKMAEEERKRLNKERKAANVSIKTVRVNRKRKAVGKGNLSSKEKEVCTTCKGTDGDPDDWLGCDNCGSWFHKWCVVDLAVLNMSEEALRQYEFKCSKCELVN